MSRRCLIEHFPTEYKGFKINTSFREALRAIEILENPANRTNEMQSFAAYLAAIDCIFVDKDVICEDKLGLEEAIAGVLWWLNGGDSDPVEEYWETWHKAPDIDDASFSMEAYTNKKSDNITITITNPDGSTRQEEVSKVVVVEYDAPDGTTRYYKKYNGEPPRYSFYEDAELIYSAFYKVFNIDLDLVDLHWFKFNLLLCEIINVEGSVLYNKVAARSFNPDEYDSKTHKKFIKDSLARKWKHRVLGYLPYIK